MKSSKEMWGTGRPRLYFGVSEHGREFVDTLVSGKWHRSEDLYRTVSGVATREVYSEVLGDLYGKGVILVSSDEGKRR